MYILGISAYFHDAAAALLQDDHIIAAAQEERFTRRKHDPSFPARGIAYCLKEAGLGIEQIDHIVFYESPALKFKRLVHTCVDFFPQSIPFAIRALPSWLTTKLYWRKRLQREFRIAFGVEIPKNKIGNVLHHQAHAASTFFPSPFEDAAILVIDGVGEFATTSIHSGRGNTISPLWQIDFPYSLGLLYSAFTYYTGFKVDSGEYKVMGLAPYGRPKYVGLIKDNLIDVKEDGSFKLNLDYFSYPTGSTMTSPRFHALFGGLPRKRESELTQREMDLACSIQAVTEEIMLKLARKASDMAGSKNLCLAGGVALNCVSNGKIHRAGFKNIWVQPAAGDAGGALGAAYSHYHEASKRPRTIAPAELDKMQGSYLGPKYSNVEVAGSLDGVNAVYHQVNEEELVERIVDGLMEGKIIGWHQGRMEFGPRALGARSIIGDARNPKMQSAMNLKIKYRESFRPFAPSVLRERVGEYFELDADSPYMLLVAPVKPHLQVPMKPEHDGLFGIDKLNVPRSTIPAVTHIDYSARIQTVHRGIHLRYHRLLNRLHEKAGIPLVINTSFNVRGEPIVMSPGDSYRCFMRTEIDILAIENFVLYKPEQPHFEDSGKWQSEFELD